MTISYFYNFSARTYPNYSETAFNTMVVSDGYIINAGLDLKKPHQDIPSIDLGGCVITPPFVDSHIHFLQTGIVLSGLQLNETLSLQNIFDAVTEECKKNKIVLGWNLDVSQLKEERFPTLAELDSISKKNFIWLASSDLHQGVANSEALNWAKKNYPGLTHKDGLISGAAYNELAYKINDLLPESYKVNALKKAEQLCLEKGIASVHAMEGSEENPYESLLVDKFFKTSTIEGIVYNQSSRTRVPLQERWKQMGGCILVDGSIGSRTAAMFEPYADEDTKGNLFLNSDKVMAITKAASESKLQLALHAIGDMACDIVAASYMWAAISFGQPELPNRIEHFLLPNNKAIRNARKSNAIIGIQPLYDYLWGGKNGLYVKRLGRERASNCNPYKTLADSGLTLIGGSDSPVTPIEPFLNLYALVNHSNPDERMGLNQAFSIFINEPHRAIGNFDKKGQLKIGKAADFICLSNDPFFISSSRIKDTRVIAMYLGGKKIKGAIDSI